MCHHFDMGFLLLYGLQGYLDLDDLAYKTGEDNAQQKGLQYLESMVSLLATEEGMNICVEH